MSMDKSIASGKEHRKEYMKLCERIDPSCRCHGGCEFCLGNRMYRDKKMKIAAEQRFEEYYNEGMEIIKRRIEQEEPDWMDADVEGVTLNGESLDGHYFDRMIEELED